MRDSLRSGIVTSFLAAAGAFLMVACAGRAASHAQTSPQPPPISKWERPARMSGAATPAVRLDRKEKPDVEQASVPCGAGCVEPGAADEGVRVNLDRGMTLYSLAREYGVPVETIIEVNGIRDPSNIRAGTEIYIPTGGPAPPAGPPAPPAEPPRQTPRKARSKGTEKTPEPEQPNLMSIAWPLDGLITGRFGQRGKHHHHDGIDIDGVRGEEVHAVASGIVVRSGSEGNYGKTVVIDHGGGLSTLYAHASRLLVNEGETVEQGEAIAEVGATGNAHGTHLHFEVRRDGQPVDPLPYLKPEMVGARSSH